MKLKLKLAAMPSERKIGYDLGITHSLIVIMKILADNDITMKEKEFWKEYRLLKKEGVI